MARGLYGGVTSPPMLTLRRARMCVYVCIRTLPAGAHTYTGFDTVGADRPYSAWILILHGRIHYRARIKDICILMDRAECIWRFIYAFRRVRATHPCLGGGECEKKKKKKREKKSSPLPSIITEGMYICIIYFIETWGMLVFEDTFWILFVRDKEVRKFFFWSTFLRST